MEGYAIEVGDGLVDGGRRGSVTLSAIWRWAVRARLDEPREPFGKNRLDQYVLVVEEKHRCDVFAVR